MQECKNALVLMFLKTALLVLKKDFAIEVKSLEILSTTMFFAVGCVLVFAFALVKEGQAPQTPRRRFSGSRCCLRGRWRSGAPSSVNATARRFGRSCWHRRPGRRCTSANSLASCASSD